MGNSTQKGSSLVEVMVALFVLAIGLLGVLAMQTKSMQYNQSAHVYSQAVYLANDMAERIRANAAQVGQYEVAKPTAPGNCDVGACDGDALATWDLYYWHENIERLLPAGQGAIEVQGNMLRIEVSFDDGRVDSEEARSGQNYSPRKSYELLVGI